MVDWQKKWFKRDQVRPSPLGLNPAAACGDTAPDTGAPRGVPCASTTSSSAIGATSTAAAPAELPEYIDA